MNERGMVVHVVDWRLLLLFMENTLMMMTISSLYQNPQQAQSNHMFLMSPLNRIDEQQKIYPNTEMFLRIN